MASVGELVQGLFSDPKATMYQAREEENRSATLILAVVAIGLQVLLTSLTAGPGIGLLAGVGSFVIFFLSIWIGGALTGGSGSGMDILQLCGLVYLPLGLASSVPRMIGLGWVGSIFSWIVSYFMMLIGHNFNGFDDVKFAYVAATVVSIVGYAMMSAAMVPLMR